MKKRIPLWHEQQDGFTLIEAVIASVLLLSILLGFLPMLYYSHKSIRSSALTNKVEDEAHRMMELLRSYDYSMLGPGTAEPAQPGQPPFLGFVDYDDDGKDPNEPWWQHTITLNDNIPATRYVLIEPIDDPEDGLGAQDIDQVVSPTDGSIMDYKRVTVLIQWTDPLTGEQLQEAVRTNIYGHRLNEEFGKPPKNAQPAGPGDTSNQDNTGKDKGKKTDMGMDDKGKDKGEEGKKKDKKKKDDPCQNGQDPDQCH